MKLGYQASDSENAYDFFLGFFFQSDRSTLYQETHSTLNAKKKPGDGLFRNGYDTFVVKFHGSVLFSLSHKSQGRSLNKIIFKFNHKTS